MNVSRTLAGVTVVAFVVGTSSIALPAVATQAASRPDPLVIGACGVPTEIDAGLPPVQHPSFRMPYLSRTHWNAW